MKDPATSATAESLSSDTTPVLNTSAARSSFDCATSCSATTTCFSKDSRNFGVMTSVTRSR